MRPLDLLDTADILVNAQPKKPTEANLRRAVSSVYYAVFHTLAKNSADLLVGGNGASKHAGAWRRVYRGLDHHTAKVACNIRNQHSGPILRKFPVGIQDFANAFVTLQERRHSADYDPYAKFTKSDVKSDIALARQVIADFNANSPKHRSAFCVHVIIKHRA